MVTRIRVRKGDTEVEYEGSEQFLRTELSSLLQAASTFPVGSGSQAQPAAPGAAPDKKTSGRKSSDRKSSGGKSSGGKAPAAPASDSAASDSAASDSAASDSAASDSAASASRETKAPAAPTTADIARKIGCKHGTDLVLAASAQLTLCAGQKSFSRAALLAEMKAAARYYNPVHGKNLSRYLKNLIKDRQMNQPRPNVFGLTAAARREIEKILAD